MENPYKKPLDNILGVEEGQMESELETFDVIYSLTSEEAIEILAENPEKLEDIEKTYSVHLDEHMLSPNFKKKHPKAFRKMNRVADTVSRESEAIVKEIFPITLESYKSKLAIYFDDLGVRYDQEELLERLNGIKAVALDGYRYAALPIIYPGLFGGDDNEDRVTAYWYSRGKKIVFNMSSVDRITDGYCSKLGNDKRKVMEYEIINSILRHELTHAAGYNNFWALRGERMDFRERRRSGISNSPARHDDPIRLNRLNEAITQKVTIDTHEKFFTNMNDKGIDLRIDHDIHTTYKEEVAVLNLLLEFVELPYIVAAYFNKKDLMSLNRELKEKIGITLSDIDEEMEKDWAIIQEQKKKGITEYKNPVYAGTIKMLKSKMPFLKKIKYLVKSL